MIRSGNICLSLVYNYLLTGNNYEKDDTGGNKTLINKNNKLKCLTDTFSSYGGVLAKLSQLLCYDTPENNSFSDCKPFSKEKTIKYLRDEFEINPEFFRNISEIDFDVLKSGSIGQIHKAIYEKNGVINNIILKVQYVGLAEQIKSDLFILDVVIKFLYNNMVDMSKAIVDIRTQLFEELDYKLEAKNQQMLFELWKNDDLEIKISEIIPELCTDNILSMNFMEGENLNNFIKNSTHDEKNNIGVLIAKFVFINLYKHNIFYSDIHYGNFLVQNKNKLCVMDFGCLHFMDESLVKNLCDLHEAILEDNEDVFYDIVEKMNIINSDISTESKIYIYEYFKLQYTPWITKDFEFTEKWLDKSTEKNLDLMKEWQLPSNIVYLNKIPFGMYNLLTKLNLKCDFTEFFDELLR
jgi:predicted unusual protein kinase regulating ubiquinone biosynthesis (AarF/ABC1/UbiB family)